MYLELRLIGGQIDLIILVLQMALATLSLVLGMDMGDRRQAGERSSMDSSDE